MKKNRRLVIDVGHPADLHFYRLLYEELKTRGWRCLFVAKDKDVIVPLLKAYHLPFVVMAKNKGGLLSKILQLPFDLSRFYRIIKRFRPSMALSAVSLHCSWVCAIVRIPHVAFIDSEHRPVVDAITLPFLQAKVTAFSYYRTLGKNHFHYEGNHEIAYLHPRRFKPDASVKAELGLAEDEPYVIVRFVAWKAFHDVGVSHLSEADRICLIHQIQKHKRVFITAEASLPVEFRPYLFPLAPHRLHDALAFADLYVGEGTTTASEAVTLGTPAILFNSLRVGYCIDAEKHGMLFSFNRLSPQALQKIEQLLLLPQIKSAFHENYCTFMPDKIDVMAFMAWFVHHYPASMHELKSSPDFAQRFLQ